MNGTGESSMKRLVIVSVFTFILLVLTNQALAFRGLKRVSEFNHKKGTIGTYRALIIGIQNYNDPEIPDLDTPLNDANQMAEVLEKKYGFTVETLLDGQATKKAIYDSLRRLTAKAKSQDSILIYYAGHGDVDRQYNDGWWIPVDAAGGDPFTYLDNIQIQKAMRSMKARHVLLISDSCYSGALFGQARSMPAVISDKYYLNLYNEKSRWGMTSGNKTPVSDSGAQGHSVFAYQLIKKLENNEKPYITTQEVYTDIAPVIANNSEQTPLCRPIRGTGDQGGEFVFVATPTYKSTQDNLSYAIDPLKAERDKIEQQRKALELERQAIEKKRLELEKEAIARQKAIIAQEKKQLEQIKIEQKKANQKEQQRLDLERKKLESEKKVVFKENETRLAAISPADKLNQIVDKDNQYIKYESGIIIDKSTKLEWYMGPDYDTTFFEADRWAERLDIDGGGWKLPSKEQLKTLYQKGQGDKNLTRLLDTSGWWFWGSDKKSLNRAWNFDFKYGEGKYVNVSFSYQYRAFAVRDKNAPAIKTSVVPMEGER